MTTITIREIKNAQTGQPNALVIFDHSEEGEHEVTIRDPFSPEQKAELGWYFEDYVKEPDPAPSKQRAGAAAASVQAYGEELFQQVFGGSAAGDYHALRKSDLNELAFEITGSEAFQALHWETLKDPALPRAFSLDVPMIRKNVRPRATRAAADPSPTLNVLVVTARPHGRKDVAYRTISRPLVEALEQTQLPVRLDILRPGTFKALAQHLAGREGFYHIIHFDLHGGLLTYNQYRAGRSGSGVMFDDSYAKTAIDKYEGHKAFLAFESEDGSPGGNLVEAADLAALLNNKQVPVVILNACQSGMQEGKDDTSVASRLMEAGVQVAVGMSYSVTVSAARVLMTRLYQALFDGADLSAALRQGRLELFNDKQRKGYYNRRVSLEDWILPVVYQNAPFRFIARDFSRDEAAAFYAKQARAFPFPQPAYGFFGRDLDILEIEHRLLGASGSNLLLIHGMGGAGKTTLLRHLGAWWQKTGFVGEVFYFGYDQQPYTVQAIVHAIAPAVIADFEKSFQYMPPEAVQAMLVQKLKGTRHLLILDNLESVTGEHLAIGTRLPPEEREKLKAFLAQLAGGKTPVLLGSRGEEQWLTKDIPALQVYDLGGLDEESATDLADTILKKIGQEKIARPHPDFPHLLKLLAGYPLAIEVVLPNLRRQTVSQVLEALQKGLDTLDPNAPGADPAAPTLQAKTRNILKCVEYAYSNLSEGAQALLMCLAPFSGVLNTDWIANYTDQLRAQPALAHLPFEQWTEVLAEATRWGLLSPNKTITNVLNIQPILPYFLRTRRNKENEAAFRAVETAFTAHYRGIGNALSHWMEDKDPQQRQTGQILARLEYENLLAALDLALAGQESIYYIYRALQRYLKSVQQHVTGLALAESTRVRLLCYPPEQINGPLGEDYGDVLDNRAYCLIQLKQFEQAAAAYQEKLAFYEPLSGMKPERKASIAAVTYHQLGVVAQAQRQWAQADDYYQQALQIFIDYNDRYRQATVYHQLGMVAQAQRQWTQAEGYYQQALQIYNDRYERAGTYHQLGAVAQAQRQWAQAEGYYQQALQIFSDYNDRYSQASTYNNLGAIAQAQRQWAQAEGYYQQALKIKIDYNDRYSQAATYHQLGRVAQEQRQWAQAEGYYQQALQIYIDYNDRYGQAQTYVNLGIVARSQEQWDAAKAYYRQALERYLEFNDTYSIDQYTLSNLELLRRSAPADLGLDIPGMVAEVMGISPAAAEERLQQAWEMVHAPEDGESG